jgi:HAMP domain-containing protein
MSPKQENNNEHHLHKENRFLQETILSLRENLETLNHEKDKCVADAVSFANDEIKQLQATITSLRQELEKTRYENEQNVVSAVSDAKDEIKQLKDTITSLRQELEQNNARHEEALQESSTLITPGMRKPYRKAAPLPATNNNNCKK